MARTNFFENLSPQTRILAGGENLIGVTHVKEVMRDTLPLFKRDFGAANVHAHVELQGIRINNLPLEPWGQSASQCHCQDGFSGSRRPGDHHQRRYTVKQIGQRLQRRTIE